MALNRIFDTVFGIDNVACNQESIDEVCCSPDKVQALFVHVEPL